MNITQFPPLRFVDRVGRRRSIPSICAFCHSPCAAIGYDKSRFCILALEPTFRQLRFRCRSEEFLYPFILLGFLGFLSWFSMFNFSDSVSQNRFVCCIFRAFYTRQTCRVGGAVAANRSNSVIRLVLMYFHCFGIINPLFSRIFIIFAILALCYDFACFRIRIFGFLLTNPSHSYRM